jgi:hypothetical protein
VNQKAAFVETVAIATDLGMPNNPGTALGLDHLRDMLSRFGPDFSEAKLGRWLGWAQCALVAANVGFTLDDAKALNMRHAGPDQQNGSK